MVKDCYIHGYRNEERKRLLKQARSFSRFIHKRVDFQQQNKVLDLGTGVGAQAAILLERFPHIQLTGIDNSEEQIAAAHENLSNQTFAKGRFELLKGDICLLDQLLHEQFDAAFMCWTLEHINDPLLALSQAQQRLNPKGKLVITEVINSSFLLRPICPNFEQFWKHYLQAQRDLGGDSDIGLRLHDLLKKAQFSQIEMHYPTFCYNSSSSDARNRFIEHWIELCRSALPVLCQQKPGLKAIWSKAEAELRQRIGDTHSVLFYCFAQAIAQK